AGPVQGSGPSVRGNRGEIRRRPHWPHRGGPAHRAHAGHSREEHVMNEAQTQERRIGPVVLDLKNISLAFGGVKALTDISFDIREHEIRSIIGPNGAGKSSMLNVINGVYAPQKGEIVLRDRVYARMNSRH